MNRRHPLTIAQFRVADVACQHCVSAITREVTALTGVQHVEVSINDKLVTVEHTDQVDTAAIVAAINEAGYDNVVPLG